MPGRTAKGCHQYADELITIRYRDALSSGKGKSQPLLTNCFSFRKLGLFYECVADGLLRGTEPGRRIDARVPAPLARATGYCDHGGLRISRRDQATISTAGRAQLATAGPMGLARSLVTRRSRATGPRRRGLRRADHWRRRPDPRRPWVATVPVHYRKNSIGQ